MFGGCDAVKHLKTESQEVEKKLHFTHVSILAGMFSLMNVLFTGNVSSYYIFPLRINYNLHICNEIQN